jgi:hypothetical protein
MITKMTDIIDKRRGELIRIKSQIRQEKIYIQKDESAIERMRKITGGWSSEQIANRKVKNSLRENEISFLKKRLDGVEKGDFDIEFVGTAKEKKTKELPVAKQKSVIFHKLRSDNNMKREIDKNWQYFVKTRETIPAYMIKKLKNMPNNKGYIWKSIYCYGERPANIGEPVILFETQRDGVLVIHETTEKEYKIWHKKGTAKKILYSCTPRRKINSVVSSLGNYIKTK